MDPMETWQNIRCNTFKTAPWVNLQHEEFKNIHKLGGHLGVVLFLLKTIVVFFFHPKKVADWIS